MYYYCFAKQRILRPNFISIGRIHNLKNGKWVKSFFANSGVIYLNKQYISKDFGNSFYKDNNNKFEEITKDAAGAILSNTNLFYAISSEAIIEKPGIYHIKIWRSDDNLRTILQEYATFYIPDGPKRKRHDDEFYGIGVYRSIIELPDNSWIMTMYGNFAQDELIPQDNDAKLETKFMMRTFIVKSTDQGRTWHYLSSVAIPRLGEPIGEGFVEPTMILLDDGRLLCIMRTGHHFPLYSSWSSDNGATWTSPVYTGFDRGIAPCLINLHNGRVALSWGRRYAEGWSQITSEGDQFHFKYPGKGYTCIALSDDGGQSWYNQIILRNSGSCYSTIFEVQPNVIFLQVDGWNCRISIEANSR